MATTDQGSQQSGARPTVVLVHGAFADASSWNGVIERLQQQGYTCIPSAINPPKTKETFAGDLPD